jgi:hypothetical protein
MSEQNRSYRATTSQTSNRRADKANKHYSWLDSEFIRNANQQIAKELQIYVRQRMEGENDVE